MIVYITVKSLGKKKSYLNRLEWTLTNKPDTLKALITDLVTVNVQKFNQKETDVPLVPYLTQSDVELQAETGKVGFGSIYNEQRASIDEALCTAMLAFEDGLYKVFINGDEIEQLDSPLHMQDGDELALIRFTMLAGKMW
ncbi:hypothetical protein SAMN04487969_12326 [Paenibacillus algorifonticola]|uniref:Uncharacterized protein n=1 Tax=Paenibacillus algorifonticola TaxID=684063 RepID=A0A1I2HGC1_9BACL|nr:hypothetical protein [Paenibacillus algorifonticola]SFF28689.1 hypothetical protein SAMN04487969_12326 [Paenibacillus algorifonticola]